MAATCGKCGDCCKVIVLARPKKVYRDFARWCRQWDRYWAAGGTAQPEEPIGKRLREDCLFIATHWHRISQEDAAERLPGMGYPGAYFYTCDQWDTETGLCMAHADRPPICRDFPWYQGNPSRLHPAFTRCTFWRDVPQERWHEGVRLPALIQIQRRKVA